MKAGNNCLVGISYSFLNCQLKKYFPQVIGWYHGRGLELSGGLTSFRHLLQPLPLCYLFGFWLLEENL